MSDPDARPDPMDKAYVEAEAVLDDADARAARRARVLAAVAQDPAPLQTAPAASTRVSAWRRGRWLAAACVAGLGLLVAIQIYHPVDHEQQIASAARATATSAAQAVEAAPAPPAPAASEALSPPAAGGAQPAAMPASPPAAAKAAPPPPTFTPAPNPPPALAVAPSPRAFPAAAPPPPPPPPSSGVVVTAERRESVQEVADQSTARGAVEQAPAAVSAFAGQSRAAPLDRDETLAGLPQDPAARLRAAAAAGRTAELRALLAEGAPVDAADADGKTALMESIQADHPAAAALLRSHGASLDRKDRAGESARDMAGAKGDATLNQALGLGP